MKILFLAPQPFFTARGTPINVRNVLKVLGEAGHGVDLLAYHLGDDVEMKNVNITRTPPLPLIKRVPIGFSPAKIPLDALMLLKALITVRKNGYDCVHAVEESVFIAWLLKKIYGLPYVYDMDSAMTEQLQYTGKLGKGRLLSAAERLEREAARGALCVLTVCRALSEKVKTLAPGAVVFQAEDCPLEVEKRPPSLTRAALGIDGGDLLVMYTGNLEPYQGAGLLLKSFRRVLGEFPTARLVIAGGEPRQADELKRQARQAGMEWSVKFAGKVPPEEASTLLKLADILVSPRLEGTNTPLKIYDYLASGVPVVATDLPMHTQVLDSKTAVLAAPEPETFAAGIVKLARSSAIRKRLGRSGKKLAAEKYGFGAFRDKILGMYSFIENSLDAEKQGGTG